MSYILKPSPNQYLHNHVLDDETGAIRVIENEHALSHLGLLYSAHQSSVALANDGFLYFEIKPPENVEVHLKAASVWVLDEHWIYKLVEAPTFTTGSTALSILNRNRGSALSARTSIKTNPTAISGGTTLDQILLGGGSGVGATSSAGLLSLSNEWELKDNATTILSLQNKTGAASKAWIEILFYELPER